MNMHACICVYFEGFPERFSSYDVYTLHHNTFCFIYYMYNKILRTLNVLLTVLEFFVAITTTTPGFDLQSAGI